MDLEKTKKMIVGQSLVALQTNDDYINNYSIPYLFGLGIDWNQKELDRIQKIKLQDFNKFLNNFFANNLSVIEVGPN